MDFLRNVFIDPDTSQIRPFWRGHLFLFDRPSASAYPPLAGTKLLAIFALLEFLVRPLLVAAARGLTFADRPWWTLAQVTILTILGGWLVTGFAGVRLSQLGLYAWRNWSKTEKLYFLQVIPIAILVFSSVFSERLEGFWARSDLGQIGLFIFLPRMIWGFYQEFVYRGLLQTELVRRWGTLTGILVSNLIFTFGPLHAYHFALAQGNPSHLWIFAATFGIGLFFAILFKRSGNLGMVGIMHGIGDVFIDGLAQVSSMVN
ncbi:MAG TPA: type II CAAX endopeptidase family protein [Anaerolineales bacterium]|nr:type II CAAX endopeptidase family protein [Anaerolineales bacterium]